MADLEYEVDMLDSRLIDMENALISVRGQWSEVEKTMYRAQEETEAVKRELRDANAEIEGLEATRDELQSEVDRLTDRYANTTGTEEPNG